MLLCDLTGEDLTLFGFGGLPTGRLTAGGESALGDECRLVLSWSKLLWLLSLSVFCRGFLPLRFFRGLLSRSEGESIEESGESSLRGVGGPSSSSGSGEDALCLTGSGGLLFRPGRLLSRLGLRLLGLELFPRSACND